MNLRFPEVFSLVLLVAFLCSFALPRTMSGRIENTFPQFDDTLRSTVTFAERDVPDYLVQDGPSKITYNRVPSLDEVPYPVRMEPNLVVEFYSR